MGKERIGDCYEASAKFILHHREMPFVLCHGTCTATRGTAKGKPIGHAWLELDELCFNVANGKQVVIFKHIYYHIGKCRDVQRYTLEQAREKLLATEHWGPWHETDALHAPSRK